MKAPCHGCDHRLVGCHSLCPEYREWRKKYEEMLAAKHTEMPELCRRMKKLLWRRMLRR